MKAKNLWYLLLLLGFAGTLFPFWYNRAEPQLFGIPFFYWYQVLWVVLTPFLMGAVVIATRGRDDV